MNTSRKILANLGYRVYRARHLMNTRRSYLVTSYEFLYYEAVSEWVGLHNAFQEAKRIYFENTKENK